MEGDPKYTPAVEEALNYGEHCETAAAPDTIQTLGRALSWIEISEEGFEKVMQAIKLLQEAVRGE
jgi:hypothetical protein